ncbi:MAG: 3-phosphoshikimate 1-carboxyvinyltransferase [Candidatus Hydrothermarchaeaceae archaeon]
MEVRGVTGLRCTVEAPPSKSFTHRALVIGALAEGDSIIGNYLRAGDTVSTINALKTFGVEMKPSEKKELLIQGSRGVLKTPRHPLDCGNSGTTIRLMSSVAALDGRAVLTGDTSLQKRPMQPLLDALIQLGVKAYSIEGGGTPPVVIEGNGIKGGYASIRGDVSSQFISSLLLTAPYAENDVELEITSPLKSKPYVDITFEVMRSFGVTVENDAYKRFTVKCGRVYEGREYRVEGDYSSGAYFLALAALTGSRISIKGLSRESIQGDRLILDILTAVGAEVFEENELLTVSGGELKPIEMDLGDAPDLLPTVAALMCKAEGRSIIRNVGHARFKESDRLSSCAREFSKFGAKIEELEDGLSIEGKKALEGSTVDSGGDHRMALALTIMGLAAEGHTTIKNAECAEISFPGFHDIISSLLKRK